jgi:hypothetical protein
VPLDARLDFPDEGGPLPRRPQARAKSLALRRHYITSRVVFSLIALPPLAAILGAVAFSLWLLASDALGALDATLALSGVFLVAVVVSRLTGRGIGGILMLIGWGAVAALIWGVVGRAICALFAGG